jgi:membrane protease YdiL (CAAX protease family)
MCGRPAPAEIQGSSGLHAESQYEPAPEVVPDAKAGRKAGWTVAAVIGLNLVLQIALAAFVVANNVEVATAVRISLFAGLAFYALVAVWVVARSADLGLRPRVGLATRVNGVTEGFIVGAVMAVSIFAVLRLVAGHPVVDPTTGTLAVQGSIGGILLGFLLVAVAAPVVEEFVFRGFLLEAFRERGKGAAIVVSAIAFSLAHLRLAQFRYYVAMGIVLALIYWRRGLVGSVTAHATFNGMLMVLAIVASHGPAVDARAAGATVAVPPTYYTTTGVAGDDLMAIGPLGSRVELAHNDVPATVDARALAGVMASGALPFPPQIVPDYTTATVIGLPAGAAVSMEAAVEGHDGRLVVIPKPGRLWVAVFRSDGSARALEEFDAMLRSWRLPTTI